MQLPRSKRLWAYDFGNHRPDYRGRLSTAEQVAEAELRPSSRRTCFRAEVLAARSVVRLALSIFSQP
jgi:hypothetical protein